MKSHSGIAVLPYLPTSDANGDGERLPVEMIGAVIVRIGAAANSMTCGDGRLVIDYMPSGSTVVQRVILGFSEADMWIKFSGLCRT